MNEEKLVILEELLEESLQDKKKTQVKIEKNLNRISEIDSFLDSIRNHEESDFKVFSPRTSESLHKDEISKVNEEKIILNNSNDSYFKELNKIDDRIEKLSFLIRENKKTDDNMHLAFLDIQEKERSRIAKELHDSSLQNLAHLIHNIELASLFIDQDPVRAKLELASCSQSLKQIINEIRDTVFNLRPMSFDDLGFKQCIENLIDNLKRQYKDYEIDYDVDEISYDNIDSARKDVFILFLATVYRVIQEAMMNSVKHSNGSKLELSVKKDSEKLLIEVIDNGKGFSIDIDNSDNNHFGISIMRERVCLLGGKFEINSKLEQGTKIFINVPLP